MFEFHAFGRRLLGGVAVVVVSVCAGPARSQEASPHVESLRRELAELKDQNTAMEDRLAEAMRQIRALQSRMPGAAGSAASPLDRALEEVRETPGETTPAQPERPARPGGPRPRLVDLSLVTDFAGGSSTLRNDPLELLQGGEHDPRQRGFTLQQVELSLIGAVDPYFMGEAHLIYFLSPAGESEFEIEEAFLTTQSLPWDLQLKAGQFFTEFGRMNAQHPHFWHWQDQPVVLTRTLGSDGMRGPGTRLAWLSELPWYSELYLSAQNANGETMVSFLSSDEFENALGEPVVIGGRPFVERDLQSLDELVYLARWYNAWDPSEVVSTALGISAAHGPNSSGPDGDTWIYGVDAVMKWRPAHQRRGWPFLVLESEYVFRDYDADDNPAFGLPSDTLRDWGGYLQGLWGFKPRWAAGLRLEYASASGPSVGGRDDDPFRDDRMRISPLLAFYPSEYSRLRLQYNYDRATHLEDDDAHTVWLGFEFSIGAHPAHRF